MRINFVNLRYLIVAALFFSGCKTAVKQQEDKIYSRHLQRHVELTIINTPMPDEKSNMNLLLFNDGNDLQNTGAKEIIDSLYGINLLQPLVLVGIHSNEKDELGLSEITYAGNTGSKAAKYNRFVINELYPFIKKKTGVRKFRSVVICGYSLGGISAFDIAWENADKIDKAGIFSVNLDYARQNPAGIADSVNIVLQKIKSSKKRPKLQYWFYAGEDGDSSIFKNSQALIGIIGQKNTGTAADIKFLPVKGGSNNMSAWRQHFAAFLLWAFGN
ncbi:MAG: hypothetical protein H7258_03920 [Ferruginibacter sp.]|nr:hypothetical protein [Ferruginibacter sp.]